MRRISMLTALLCSVLSVALVHAQEAPHRELRLEVNQVTRPDVAIFPDDGSVLFTLLGHLYRLPSKGGAAVQLTHGPYFHEEPAVSPNGQHIAVVSDRVPELGDNIYVMDADGGDVRRVTSETEAGRPAWSPDGTRLAFLAYADTRPLEEWLVWPPPPARVRELDLSTGTIADVTDGSADIRDVTYGPDGTLYWVRLRKVGACRGCVESDVERRNPDGALDVVVTLDGVVKQLRVSDEGVFYTVFRPYANRSTLVARDSLTGTDMRVAQADVEQGSEVAARFGVVAGAAAVVVGDWGQLWEIDARQRTRRRIPFNASVVQTVLVSAPPPAWTPPEDTREFDVTAVTDPVLSPDGSEITFAAAGTLWRQVAGDPEALPVRVVDGVAADPSYSPVGGKVAYVRKFFDKPDELVVADGWNGAQRVLARGRLFGTAWSPDGETVLFTTERRLALVPASDTTVTRLEGWPWYTPHMPGDGSWIAAYLARPTVAERDLFRIPLRAPDEAVPITDITQPMKEPRVSADGRWLAFQRNGDLWIADLAMALADDGLVTEGEARLFASDGGFGFSFDPRGDALVFVRGNRIFRATLPDGEAEEIVGPLSLPGAETVRAVIRSVRVLSAEGTAFSAPTDLFIDGGRIAAIGASPSGFDVGRAEIVDGGGRFAVPGLWDAHLHGNAVGDMVEWLPHGVTAHRDPGSEIMEAIQEHDYDRAFGAPVPRRFASGEIFEGRDDRWWGQWNRVVDPGTARRLVRQWKGFGARFVKAYPTMPWTLHRVVAEQAAAQGLPVVGHGMFPEEIVRSITLGYRGLEHSDFPGVLHDDILTLMAAADVYWAPQYTLASVDVVLALGDPDGFARGLERMGRPPADERMRSRGAAGSLLGSWSLHAERLRRARDLGVNLLLGTDNVQGAGFVHVEFEAFQDAGFSPAEVLRMATLTAAEAEGVDEDLGTLEVGKLADLLLLDENPLDDVLNLRAPWRVIRGGRVVHARE